MITESDAVMLVSRSCALLDDEKFDDYLDLFAADSRYRITAYSPDLRRDLTYLDLDRPSLESLLRNLPQHVRLPGRFMRHANGTLIEPSAPVGSIAIATSLLVIHTDLDGNSRIFATGRYRDTIGLTDGKPRIKAREVRLDTRQFGSGSHVPI